MIRIEVIKADRPGVWTLDSTHETVLDALRSGAWIDFDTGRGADVIALRIVEPQGSGYPGYVSHRRQLTDHDEASDTAALDRMIDTFAPLLAALYGERAGRVHRREQLAIGTPETNDDGQRVWIWCPACGRREIDQTAGATLCNPCSDHRGEPPRRRRAR